MRSVLGIGFSSGTSEDPHFERLQRDLDEAQRLGVDFVELPAFTMDLISGGKIIASELKKLKTALVGRALRYTVHGPIAMNFMQAPEINARHMAVARATVEIAAELGAVHLIIHTGFTDAKSEPDIDAAYAAQRKALSILGAFAADHNVILTVENIFVSHESDHTALPSKLAAEIGAIDHPNVRACLDFSHAAITCRARGADFLTEAKALARVAKHLHIHDSFGDPTRLRTVSRSERMAYGLGDLHLPLGWGNLPWDKIMSECAFPDDVVFNLELPHPYAHMLGECVTRLHELRDIYRKSSVA